jgi:hypothetical protein
MMTNALLSGVLRPTKLEDGVGRGESGKSGVVAAAPTLIRAAQKRIIERFLCLDDCRMVMRELNNRTDARETFDVSLTASARPPLTRSVFATLARRIELLCGLATGRFLVASATAVARGDSLPTLARGEAALLVPILYTRACDLSRTRLEFSLASNAALDPIANCEYTLVILFSSLKSHTVANKTVAAPSAQRVVEVRGKLGKVVTGGGGGTSAATVVSEPLVEPRERKRAEITCAAEERVAKVQKHGERGSAVRH